MSRRTPDPAGLIAGIAFTGIGLAFLAGEVDMVNRARWVWPIVLFSLGAGILAAVLRRPSEEAAGGADASADRTSLSTDISGSSAWPGTEEQPAGAEAWPAVEAADEQPAAAPVPTEPSEAPAHHAESAADAEAEPVVEEPPGAAPESAPDEEPGVVEEPPASGSAADEDGEEAARRQPGGPPA
jgi:hypothetical protein